MHNKPLLSDLQTGERGVIWRLCGLVLVWWTTSNKFSRADPQNLITSGALRPKGDPVGYLERH